MNWLRDYVDIDISPKDYAAGMTMSGSKVEYFTDLSAEIRNVVAGKVLSCEKHPDADRLTVCTVNAGVTVTIVTGAGNVKPGDFVPVALSGARLPGGKEIVSGELRGVLSEGMLCSVKELCLTLQDVPYAVQDGILILENECTPGQDIREILGFDDCAVEFEITPNRPDCLSMRGLARETSATFGAPLKLPEPVVSGGGGDITELLSVRIADPDLCPRYTARMVRDIKIGPSPAWMRNRLRACGLRPISNIVDITNYVMLEYGQPMHAFDYACLDGGAIVVRRAAENEALETLDGQKRPLAQGMLLIADEAKAVGVAGVMGGANSEITGDTSIVVFESANFNGTSIRQTAIGLGMRTDASGRFEKGLDPCNTIPAVNRACELVEALGCGTVCDGLIDVCGAELSPRTLKFEPERINALLGTDIGPDFMRRALTSLGFTVLGDSITVPSWRQDAEDTADIAEEVARIYGYDRLETSMLRGETTVGGLNRSQRARESAAELCRGLGYFEALTYSFISPSCYDRILLPADSPLRDSVMILNPLGEDTGVMRTTPLPSVIEALSRNVKNLNKGARLYEFCTVYHKTADKLPGESRILTLGAYGSAGFYEFKADIEALLDGLRVEGVVFEREGDNPSYHPGRAAKILSGGLQIGVFGEIHPSVADNYGVSARLYVAELYFGEIEALARTVRAYTPLPRFPALTRDLAVVCGRDVPVGGLLSSIRECGGARLRSAELFDIYTGSQISPDKKSVAFALQFGASDRTLKDAEADETLHSILSVLRECFDAEIRQ